MTADVERVSFGLMPDGTVVDAVTLRGATGLVATMLTYGATVAALHAPDATGHVDNVVLGFDNLDAYRRSTAHFGSVVGRYANRIANGRFSLDGVDYALSANQGRHTLHGGARGFDKAVWQIAAAQGGAAPFVEFRHVSPDGDQGFPGRLEVGVRYTLDADTLRLDYAATTDRPTVVNLSNHSYFNLAGAGSGDMLGHVLSIEADRFTPIDADLIPTGEVRAVDGTTLDFRTPAPIGARIDAGDAQVALAGGYDHNFVLRVSGGGQPALAARAHEPRSERILEVWTTQPGLQFYSGNFLGGTDVGSQGRPYRRRDGFCLETQHFPDSPNRPAFPSTVLRPGDIFRSCTAFRFAIR